MASGMLGLLVTCAVIPVLLARFVVGASWAQVAAAYGLWGGLLLLVFIPMGGTWAERIGWALIVFVMLSLPVIPVVALVLRLTGLARGTV